MSEIGETKPGSIINKPTKEFEKKYILRETAHALLKKYAKNNPYKVSTAVLKQTYLDAALVGQYTWAQTYLGALGINTNDSKFEVRVRKSTPEGEGQEGEPKYTLTFKSTPSDTKPSGDDGSTRGEAEIELTEAEYEQLLKMKATDSETITKTRTTIQTDVVFGADSNKKVCLELDEYEGNNLVVCEIEAANEDVVNEVKRLADFEGVFANAQDVTSEKEYKNRNIARGLRSLKELDANSKTALEPDEKALKETLKKTQATMGQLVYLAIFKPKPKQ